MSEQLDWVNNEQQMYVAKAEYERFVSDLFKPMPRKIDCILHAAIGISGEVGEFLEGLERFEGPDMRLDANVQEELGDIRFYITAAALELGVTIPWLQEQDVPTEFDDAEGVAGLVIYAAQLLDYAKKAWAYNGELKREESIQALCQIWQSYKRTCDTLDLHDIYVRYVNVDKLAKRYPLGKYSDGDALARADKQAVISKLEDRVSAALTSFRKEAHFAPSDVVTAADALQEWRTCPSTTDALNAETEKNLEVLTTWGLL